ncbi:rRNA maturation RNase YbeY [Fervidibacillus halotolerans]|uniref:Endoribonuclease YbeY n=1 Tax=Fervidibacillus halotolerans TaxID=2980027 RepID=A0A9E8LXS0_9BACI|nr:rRNA maturation RNase YbeY [Fervidibacillus halotolerans]WAA11494.1 rRNA maturation RNase YbeY [Fervidibacillus halotolerans]
MNVSIDFTDETGLLAEEQVKEIIRLLEFAAQQEGIEQQAELSLTFVDNERITEINRDYRGKNQPTDVISFALEERAEGELEIITEQMPRVLGDIIISVPKAEEQAKEYGHSFMRELGFLSVHGFLHLLGYNHETEAEEKEMFTRQELILQKYGLTR